MEGDPTMKREASLDARSGPRSQGILPRGATVIQCRMDLRTEPPDSSRGPLAMARMGPSTARASRAALAVSAAGHLKAAPGPLDGVCSTS